MASEGSKPVVLVVAEKPSIAGAVTTALCTRGAPRVRGGGMPVHEFDGEFRRLPVLYRVTSVRGHVFSTDFPSEYQSWDAVDPVELFRAPVVKNDNAPGVPQHLARAARGAKFLVLFLDCDREGENICFEVIQCVQRSLARSRPDEQTIFRAKFSAVAREDILRAMDNLGVPSEEESLSVDARQEIDLKVGVAFSRFQTRFFQGKYGDLDSKLITYGPCQTPTLGFCVARADEIATFVPEPFWVVDASISHRGSSFDLEWGRGRCFDQVLALTFMVRMVRWRSHSNALHGCRRTRCARVPR
jgi:DNA topoisomerase III